MVFFVFEVFFVPKKKLQNKKTRSGLSLLFMMKTIAYMYTVIYYMIYCTQDCAALHQSLIIGANYMLKKTLSLSDKCVYIFATLNWANY